MAIINKYSLLEIFLAHEIQLHEAIKKNEWKVAARILYAMSEALPKPEPVKVCNKHHRQLNADLYCADCRRTLNEGEY
jgi:hypothetical protein